MNHYCFSHLLLTSRRRRRQSFPPRPGLVLLREPPMCIQFVTSLGSERKWNRHRRQSPPVSRETLEWPWSRTISNREMEDNNLNLSKRRRRSFKRGPKAFGTFGVSNYPHSLHFFPGTFGARVGRLSWPVSVTQWASETSGDSHTCAIRMEGEPFWYDTHAKPAGCSFLNY